jgi:hypothetical protein
VPYLHDLAQPSWTLGPWDFKLTIDPETIDGEEASSALNQGLYDFNE